MPDSFVSAQQKLKLPKSVRFSFVKKNSMAIALFYISLFFLVAMFALKYFGVSFEHHEVISNIVCKNDEHCTKIVSKSKNIFSKIKFKNFHRLTVAIINFTKRETLYLKRRFDSKQPAFFLSVKRPNAAHKNSVSFFLKKVSEYKDSMKDKNLPL